ncbi:unannotated protein [freshwater metagenome]|uniref:Unannotated protein n=1 Tax=freshwater metagenome TaxID=449393 RepID=A0A6J7ILX3_9ZZZZ
MAGHISGSATRPSGEASAGSSTTASAAVDTSGSAGSFAAPFTPFG